MLWEPIITEETCDYNMDYTSYQPQRSPSSSLGNTAALLELGVEELCFYDDEELSSSSSTTTTASVAAMTTLHHNQEQHLHRSLTISPQFLGLLSPENSPQRLHLCEKSNGITAKFLQDPTSHQTLSSGNNGITNGCQRRRSTTSSNITPGKSFRVFHSLSSNGSSAGSSIDDEYMDLFEMESLEDQLENAQLSFPSNLTSLISGQIKSNSPPAGNGVQPLTPQFGRPSVRRCLSLTENNYLNQQQQQQQLLPKSPEIEKTAATALIPCTNAYNSRLAAVSPNCGFKRPDPPSATCSPIQTKRHRPVEKEKDNFNQLNIDAITSQSVKTSPAPQLARPALRKCMSMNDADIMSALARSESSDDLIGDFSKPFALPLMEGRHRDLKSISSDTVARLLRGEFANQVASYTIIDCRYPYEFEGGHIRGAKNLFTQEQIIEEFLTQRKTEQQQARSQAAGNKRNIFIFHCEFSSERGPKLSRFLRNNDRARNTNSYPLLDYPEVYLLHNGYKEFYEHHKELCDPVAYRPMLEPAFNEAYRHFRAKSKSWNGDGIGGTSRMKKSRSRLML